MPKRGHIEESELLRLAVVMVLCRIFSQWLLPSTLLASYCTCSAKIVQHATLADLSDNNYDFIVVGGDTSIPTIYATSTDCFCNAQEALLDSQSLIA